MFYVRRIYYCPHCRMQQNFLSIMPVLGDRWRCRGCQKNFDLDATCIGSNWAVAAALWSMPLTLLGGETFAVLSVIQATGMQHAFTKEALVRDVIAPLVCGGPLIMLMGSFFLLFVGYFVGLIYGYSITNRL